MAKITSEDILKVAKLARLDIPEDKIPLYTNQLEKILTYVDQLQKVDTKDISPTARAVEVVNVVREDSIEEAGIREELLELAPDRDTGFFKVPKIMTD